MLRAYVHVCSYVHDRAAGSTKGSRPRRGMWQSSSTGAVHACEQWTGNHTCVFAAVERPLAHSSHLIGVLGRLMAQCIVGAYSSQNSLGSLGAYFSLSAGGAHSSKGGKEMPRGWAEQ